VGLIIVFNECGKIQHMLKKSTESGNPGDPKGLHDLQCELLEYSTVWLGTAAQRPAMVNEGLLNEIECLHREAPFDQIMVH
jgi:hypothetical protein